MARIAVNIVTYNSAATIEACLEAIFEQDYRDFAVTVIDNGSTDDTVARVARWEARNLCLHVNAKNEYFSRAHNQAIRMSDSDFVLTLNPDVVVYPNYLSRIAHAFTLSPLIGSVNGKLLLLEQSELRPGLLSAQQSRSTLIDGAGLMMYRSRRPYLRGNRQPHWKVCLRPQFIFGVDAACGAYRRSMLEDVAYQGEYFDNDFVIYREDVDLAWRAQILGWDSYYVPTAVGYHARRFRLGRGRRSVPGALKRHSVRNGWLLLLKNDTLPSVISDSPDILLYQIKILAGLFTMERSSLVAISDVVRLFPTVIRKREDIQARRKRPESEIELWFE